MPGSRILRSGAFRFALLFASVFALGSILLLVIVERSIADYALEATAGSLERESKVLSSDDRSGGRSELLRAIGRRTRGGEDQPFRYVLVDAAGQRLAGDMPAAIAKPGWSNIRLSDTAGIADPEVYKSFGTRMSDGALLVIATDTYDVQELRRNLDTFTFLSGIAVTALALIGGYFVGGIFLRRLDRVNAAADRIMAGNLGERLPVIGMGPEFDHLARTLNQMLDQIGLLIDGLKQVSTDIAHDLRTPLTRLRQQLEGIQGCTSLATYETGVEAAIEQTDEILAIFRALLRIGAIDGGQGAQRFGVIDLTEIMDRVALAYQPVVEDAGKHLTLDHQRGVQAIGDAELVAQMLTNLIENAIHHARDGARIVTSLAVVDGHAVARIADDGPGVPEAERQRILRRFYRLDSSRNSPGAGLGLAMVAAIANLHAAELTIGDNAPGLIVSVRFPREGAPVKLSDA
jgi:signal transduction histidine kinase